ncbi:hypothetical protein [Legionella quinlivanii]|uniref:hypothetical protein n=1 Tax=Legionella quinlivanii TaxID=45073 RepID=UPI0022444C5D|nr:hypothetical protein [Legionella quinlivanii]MCW8450813.1 hypothetical protein [Legionella quinlivanii]
MTPWYKELLTPLIRRIADDDEKLLAVNFVNKVFYFVEMEVFNKILPLEWSLGVIYHLFKEFGRENKPIVLKEFVHLFLGLSLLHAKYANDFVVWTSDFVPVLPLPKPEIPKNYARPLIMHRLYNQFREDLIYLQVVQGKIYYFYLYGGTARESFIDNLNRESKSIIQKKIEGRKLLTESEAALLRKALTLKNPQIEFLKKHPNAAFCTTSYPRWDQIKRSQYSENEKESLFTAREIISEIEIEVWPKLKFEMGFGLRPNSKRGKLLHDLFMQEHSDFFYISLCSDYCKVEGGSLQLRRFIHRVIPKPIRAAWEHLFKIIPPVYHNLFIHSLWALDIPVRDRELLESIMTLLKRFPASFSSLLPTFSSKLLHLFLQLQQAYEVPESKVAELELKLQLLQYLHEYDYQIHDMGWQKLTEAVEDKLLSNSSYALLFSHISNLNCIECNLSSFQVELRELACKLFREESRGDPEQHFESYYTIFLNRLYDRRVVLTSPQGHAVVQTLIDIGKQKFCNSSAYDPNDRFSCISINQVIKRARLECLSSTLMGLRSLMPELISRAMVEKYKHGIHIRLKKLAVAEVNWKVGNSETIDIKRALVRDIFSQEFLGYQAPVQLIAGKENVVCGLFFFSIDSQGLYFQISRIEAFAWTLSIYRPEEGKQLLALSNELRVAAVDILENDQKSSKELKRLAVSFIKLLNSRNDKLANIKPRWDLCLSEMTQTLAHLKVFESFKDSFKQSILRSAMTENSNMFFNRNFNFQILEDSSPEFRPPSSP